PVEALGVRGDLTLETVSGEVILADTAADRVRAQTVSALIALCPAQSADRIEPAVSEPPALVPLAVRRGPRAFDGVAPLG
ncbi:hypothetical protein ACWD8I_03730, partial [Micromonospora arida]